MGPPSARGCTGDMANFKGWKLYMLFLIDRLVDEHGMTGPFLDAGSGAGDVSLHFARKGWSGTAVDFSEVAAARTREALAGHPRVDVRHGDLFELSIPPASTVLLMDVIEHVRDDDGFLRNLSRSVAHGGHLVITVPTEPHEWRWDDEFYGHYRRYRREEMRALLERNGFRVVSEWDCSWPLFWLMRRVYTRLFEKPLEAGESPEERTRKSTQQSAWDYSRVSHWIDRVFEWTRLYLVHYPFRRGRLGCEVLVAARKVGEPR